MAAVEIGPMDVDSWIEGKEYFISNRDYVNFNNEEEDPLEGIWYLYHEGRLYDVGMDDMEGINPEEEGITFRESIPVRDFVEDPAEHGLHVAPPLGYHFGFSFNAAINYALNSRKSTEEIEILEKANLKN